VHVIKGDSGRAKAGGSGKEEPKLGGVCQDQRDSVTLSNPEFVFKAVCYSVGSFPRLREGEGFALNHIVLERYFHSDKYPIAVLSLGDAHYVVETHFRQSHFLPPRFKS